MIELRHMAPFARTFGIVGLALAGRGAMGQGALTRNWTYTPILIADAVAYSPDGTQLAVGGDDGVQLYNVKTGALEECLSTTAAQANSLAYSKDGTMLAVGGVENNPTVSLGVVEIWNPRTGTLKMSLNAQSRTGVLSVQFTPNGGEVLEAGTNYGQGILNLWSTSTGKLVTSIPTQQAYLQAAAISPDGTRLADVGSSDNTQIPGVVELWNIATKTRIATFPTTAVNLSAIAFSPDGTMLADGGTDVANFPYEYTDLVEVWNLSSGKNIASLDHNMGAVVNSVAFSPDGKTLIDGGYNTSPQTGFIEKWSVASLETPSTLATALSQVNGIAVSPDGKSLADGGYLVTNGFARSSVVETWVLASGVQSADFTTYAYGTTASLALSPDGKTLAQAGNSGLYSVSANSYPGLVNLWNASTATLEATLASAANRAVTAVAYSRDGTLLIDGGYGNDFSKNTNFGVIEVWNAATRKQLYSMTSLAVNGINSLVVSHDGKTLASDGFLYDEHTESDVAILEIWDLTKGTNIGLVPSAANVWSFPALTPDGKTLIVGGVKNVGSTSTPDAVLELWDLGSGKRTASLNSKLFDVFGMSLSPDGKTIALAGNLSESAQSAAIEVWNISTQTIQTTISLTTQLSQLTYAPDGTILYVATGNGVAAFGTTDYHQLGNFDQSIYGGTFTIGLSSDQTRLDFIAGYNSIVLANNPYLGQKLSSLSVSNSTVTGGSNFTATVTLAGPAPSGGAVVTLVSGNPAAIPSLTITVKAGATSGTVQLASLPVASNASVPVTANYIGATRYVALHVLAPAAGALSVNPASVKGSSSTTVTGKVTLSGPAPTGGTKVSLKTSNAAASVPSSVTVAAGSTSATFTVSHVKVTTSTPVTLTASAGGASQTTTLTITP